MRSGLTLTRVAKTQLRLKRGRFVVQPYSKILKASAMVEENKTMHGDLLWKNVLPLTTLISAKFDT